MTDDLSDEEYNEEARSEQAHRFLEREKALGYRSVEQASGLIVVTKSVEDDDNYGQYL